VNIDAAVAKCIRAMAPDVKKTTVYLDEKTVVSVCRRFKYTVRSLSRDFVLKIGRPNYVEREFIKRCKKAGEPLPVRKVQLKFWPVKRKSK
jgi:hypothetical protein